MTYQNEAVVALLRETVDAVAKLGARVSALEQPVFELTGKWAFVNEEDYYHIGQVIGSAADGACVLIRTTSPDGPPTIRMFGLTEMMSDTGTSFFDTEAELNEWLAWLETSGEDAKPAHLKVVSIKKTET